MIFVDLISVFPYLNIIILRWKNNCIGLYPAIRTIAEDIHLKVNRELM